MSFLFNRDEILPNTCMVPFTNFTTHDTKNEENPKKGIIQFLRKTLLPPGYKNLEDKNLSPFLRIKKNKIFFTIPAMEASINSRWYQAMAYWIRPLGLYAMFLILFTNLPEYLSYEARIDDSIYRRFVNVRIGIFYYIGAYLLAIEVVQIIKYKKKYFTMFNIFDLSSIILGILVFSLRCFLDITNNYYDNDIFEKFDVISATVVLILWIEMVCLMAFET
jgi:hypothetical protein